MKIKTLALALLLSVTMFGSACHRQVVITDVPTGVNATSVANWYAACGIYNQLGTLNTQLIQTAITLKADFPDQASYDKTMHDLAVASQIGIQAGTYLQTVPNNWNVSIATQVANYANSVQAQINMALNDGLAHVKNTASQQAITTLVDAIDLAIKTGVALNTPAGGSNVSK